MANSGRESVTSNAGDRDSETVASGKGCGLPANSGRESVTSNAGDGNSETAASRKGCGLPATSTWAEGSNKSTTRKMIRPFEEILADASANRNILEIQIKKANVDKEEKTVNLSFSQLGELLFDHLGIKIEDCLRFNLSSQLKEVVLKPEISLDPYCKIINDFNGYIVTTRRQEANSVKRIQFRNVPASVHLDEITHLCSYYGTPIKVYYETLTCPRFENKMGSTIYAEVKMKPGKTFNNYYWMEGPLPGDRGARVTVLHKGQPRQCSHCLDFSDNCPGAGQGKACKELGTSLRRMKDYMDDLKRATGYQSLKNAYAQKYPNLDGSNQQTSEMNEENTEEEDIVRLSKNEYDYMETKMTEKANEIKEKEEVIKHLNQKITELTIKDAVNEEKMESLNHNLNAKYHRIDALENNLGISGHSEILEEKEEEIAALQCKLSQLTEELENKHTSINSNATFSKEISKVNIIKDGLDDFLADSLKRKDFNPDDNTYDFLVAQYSQILSTPEDYVVDNNLKIVTLSESLFEDMVSEKDPSFHAENLKFFKKDLMDKLLTKFSPRISRTSRRHSLGRCSERTPLGRSLSTKRKQILQKQKESTTKIPKPNSAK